MPKLSQDFKNAIDELPVKELRKLLLKAASKDRELFDTINLHYVFGRDAEYELFLEAKELVYSELNSVSSGGRFEKKLAKAISNAVKHINHYAKVSKNKTGEADLLLILLNEVFDNYANLLGTCWTVYDSKLAITTNRLYNLVTKKMHEDYLVQYREPINRFLRILHTTSNHLDYVYVMPKALEN